MIPLVQNYKYSTLVPAYFGTVSGPVWNISTVPDIADGVGHKITISNATATDYSALSAVIVGKDQDGVQILEIVSLPGPNSGIETQFYYKNLTSVIPSASTGNLTIGFGNKTASQTFGIEWRGGVGFAAVVVSGTVNYTFQYSPDKVLDPATLRPYNWLQDAGPLNNNSTSASDVIEAQPFAVRITTNSYSTGAAIQFTYSEMSCNR
jgi:uncharacterized membrane protein